MAIWNSVGRIDLQVKIRGYRVELGEIETVLLEDPAVAQAAVTLFEEGGWFAIAGGFLVPHAGREVSIARFKDLAAKKLPVYMRPQAYVMREQPAHERLRQGGSPRA